jgi:hypothetical protein
MSKTGMEVISSEKLLAVGEWRVPLGCAAIVDRRGRAAALFHEPTLGGALPFDTSNFEPRGSVFADFTASLATSICASDLGDSPLGTSEGTGSGSCFGSVSSGRRGGTVGGAGDCFFAGGWGSGDLAGDLPSGCCGGVEDLGFWCT